MKVQSDDLKLFIQPQVLSAVLKVDINSDISFTELEKIIEVDQNMAAMILRMANSSFFSHGNEIKSLRRAISILGLRTFRSLAVLVASKSIFKRNVYTKFNHFVWKHSVVTAILAKEIAIKCNNKVLKEESFISGLLHDLGKVALNSIDRAKFIQVIHKAVEENKTFLEAEREIFDTDHIEVGIQVAHLWHLPELYTNVIKYNEKILDIPVEIINNENIIKIIYITALANLITNEAGLGHVEDAFKFQNEYNILVQKLQLSQENIRYLKEVFLGNLSEDETYRSFIRIS